MKITRPVILIDQVKCKQNIRRMADKANSSGVVLCPHFKTHQSRAIGEWFREQGVREITVSSVTMARYFADAGWKKITIAFPINILELDQVAKLAEKVALTIFITDIHTASTLINQVALRLKVLIEIDCDYHRTGIYYKDYHRIDNIISLLNKSQHVFKGFYCHSGQTYHTNNQDQIKNIFEETVHKLKDLKLRFADAKPCIEVGDTPGCSLMESFQDVDVIHPGNFVFYDVMQANLGSCSMDDIGLVVACPVVFKSEERQEIVVYGGGVHLSKEQSVLSGGPCFGLPVMLSEHQWSEPLAGCNVTSISQEHGSITVAPSVFDQFQVGDVIGILPVHSCMTADVLAEMYNMDGLRLDHMRKSRY